MIDTNRLEDKELIDRVKKHELFCQYPYYDMDPVMSIKGKVPLQREEHEAKLGKITVGYGHNLDEPMSEELASIIQLYDLHQAEKVIYNLGIPAAIIETISRRRKNVLIEMAFIMGYKLKGFKMMIQAIKDGNFVEAKNQMSDSEWARKQKGRARELAIVWEKG
ncbi:MAG: hypothetical protein Q8M94_21175 [Ignavibacteria bacterium]|nr:hypothetical protein [Ignavibacteria bacterium]